MERRRKISNLQWSKILRKFFFDSKCSICKKEVGVEEIYLCTECKRKLDEKKYLSKRKNIYYLYKYEGEIKDLIIDYKLNGRKELSHVFSNLMEEDLKKVIRENKIQIIIPVPANNERMRTRGFNQVELILDNIGLTYERMTREKNTTPMHKIKDQNLRKFNVKSAFDCNFSINGKKILIVDDIITTGSTMKSLIKTLRKSGCPEEIFIFSICISKNFKAENFLNV